MIVFCLFIAWEKIRQGAALDRGQRFLKGCSDQKMSTQLKIFKESGGETMSVRFRSSGTPKKGGAFNWRKIYMKGMNF